MKSQSGFTLIEMVAVIIILAIMAATAMPRFTNLTGEARMSSLAGIAAAVTSAKALARSKWTVANAVSNTTFNQQNVDMGGTWVSVISSTAYQGNAAQGTPFPNYTSGMWTALDSPNNFSSAITAASGLILWPTGVTTSANCLTWYSGGNVTTFISPVNAATGCL
jgi:MSHA pilin protein MshA